MMDELAKAAAQLVAIKDLKAAVGRALTNEQQLAVSRAVTANPKAFELWLETDAGRAATRAYVDAFVPPSST